MVIHESLEVLLDAGVYLFSLAVRFRVEGGGGSEFCVKSRGEVSPELRDELGSPVGDYGVWAAVKAVDTVDKGVDQFLDG